MPASDSVINVNDATFEQSILQSDLPVALLFCTPKFPKCRQIQPLWQALAKQYAGKLRVAQVIIDDNRQWARHYGVTALPTTLWLRDGKEEERAQGLPNQQELQERAEALLAGRKPKLKAQQAQPKRFNSARGPVVLSDKTFRDAIQDERPVLVDFWAAWCGPCRTIAPAIDKLAKEMGERALVTKLNIDQNQRSAQQYRVMSIPTLLIFKRGRVIETIVGAQPGAVIRRKLMAHL